jgi:hypothetical protein
VKRLMLCAGMGRRAGWQTLDSNPNNSPDFLTVLPPLPIQVRAIQWDEIELIHGITSFYPWDAKALLIEIRDVLAPGGKLVLEQPNLDVVIERLAAREGAVYWLFGDPTFSNPAHMNKWAYSPVSLQIRLESVGFSKVELLPAQHHNPDRDFRMEAYR